MATVRICAIPDCGNTGRITRGWCDKHYQRWQKHGDPLLSVYDREQTTRGCLVEGCGKRAGHKGYCEKHFERLKRHGGPLLVSPRYRKKISWIEAHVGHDGPECLIWPFAVSDHGRGTASFGGVERSAPNVMCTLAHGVAPSDRHMAAHRCGNGHRGCMNPKHLRWATPAENEADKRLHGTLRRGRAINTAKLTEADVQTIRGLRASRSVASLADKYGVTKSAIYAVLSRSAWAWLE